MRKRKKRIVFLWVSIFILISSLSLYIVGLHSDELVNKYLKVIVLLFTIFSIISIVLNIINLIVNKRTSGIKKYKMILVSTMLCLYAIGAITVLTLLYGKKENFRAWLITTAMGTMHHQYYATWFYNDEEINEVLANNFIDDSNLGDTDENLIKHEEKHEYKDEYEREILERNKDDVYKVIRFKVNGQDAYLGVVYDPSKVSVGLSKWIGKSGQYIYDMAKEQNAVLAVNGGNFYDPNYNSNGANPAGITISDGKLITNDGTNNSLVGFNKNNTLILTKSLSGEAAIKEGIRDAVTGGPFLIVNGKPAFMRGNGGWGYAARTAIGQRADGIVLLLVVDSNETRTNGASMIDLTEIMQRYGAVNASSLDGGTSSAMVVEGTMISDPINSALQHRTRGIPTIFKVVK